MLKSIPRIKSKYGRRLNRFQAELNYARLYIAALIATVIGISTILFYVPSNRVMLVMYYILAIGSLTCLVLSLFFEYIFKSFLGGPRTVLFHLIVLFYVIWAGVQLHLSGGTTTGFSTYVGTLIAVSAVFSLKPLHALGLSIVSLLIVFSPFHIIQHPGIHFNSQLNILLINTIVFTWCIAFLHYTTTIEIFLMRDKLESKERKAELALEGGNLGYWNWDIENERIEVDERWYSMLGYSYQDKYLSFADFFALIHPSDRPQLAEDVQEYLKSGTDSYKQFFRMNTADGQWKWIYSEGQITARAADNRPLFMHGIHQDIQDSRTQQQKLIESEARFKAYTENSPVGIFIVNNFRYTYVNPGATRITGYSEEELLGMKMTKLVHPDEFKQVMHAIHDIIRKGEMEEEYVFRIVGKGGQAHWVEIRVSRLHIQDKSFLLSVVDITARKDAENRLKEYATYDELTGVYNRRVGLTMLEQEIHQSQREGKPLSICFVDINGLKKVNDTWGHDEGDFLIQSISGVMREELRKGDLLCRLGGDEFLMVYKNCNYANAVKIWERIDEELRELNSESLKEYEISVSRGILEYNQSLHADVHEFINQADKKMYVNKRLYRKRNSLKNNSE